MDGLNLDAAFEIPSGKKGQTYRAKALRLLCVEEDLGHL